MVHVVLYDIRSESAALFVPCFMPCSQGNSLAMTDQHSDRSFPTLRRTSINSPPYSMQSSAVLPSTLRRTLMQVRRRVSSSTAESHIKQGGESHRPKRKVLPPVRNGTIDMHPGHIFQQFSVPEKRFLFFPRLLSCRKRDKSTQNEISLKSGFPVLTRLQSAFRPMFSGVS